MEDLLRTSRKLYYEVTDNSYCVSLDTLEPIFLVQKKDGWYSPNPEEDGAEFEIISSTFDCNIEFIGNVDTYEFVIVKSTKTGVCYRVLYNKRNVYRRVYKKEYLFR